MLDLEIQLPFSTSFCCDACNDFTMQRCSFLRRLSRHLQVHKTGWPAHLTKSSKPKYGTSGIWSLQKGYGGGKYLSSLIDQKERLSKQEEALQATLKEISKNFGVEAVMWLGRASTVKAIPVIQTGSLTLDSALGIGGLPKGRVVEMFGPEGSGKTTLALHVIAEAQKTGGRCVFIDAEHSLDSTLAEALGVQMGSLLVAQPDNLEQAFILVDQFIRTKTIDVIVVDSVAALFGKAEVIEEATVALQARLLSQILRKLTHSISANKTLVIFINQTRSKLNVSSYAGQEEASCAGNALKCYASVRLNVHRIQHLNKMEQVSNTVVKVVKNKLAPPFKTAEFEIELGRGISKEGEVLDQAVKLGVIGKSGSWFLYNGARIGDGRENAKKILRGSAELLENLAVCVKERLARGSKEL